MEIIKLDKDIKVFYVSASSFPDGVLAAHQQLHAIVSRVEGRRFLGISRPENGTIVYKAAAEELAAGEAESYHCDTLVIKGGNYISEILPDFMDNIPAIGSTFAKLLAQPGIDPQGYCVEQYLNGKDMLCMVRLAG